MEHEMRINVVLSFNDQTIDFLKRLFEHDISRSDKDKLNELLKRAAIITNKLDALDALTPPKS